MNLSDIYNSWNTFWFKPQLPTPVALFRIAVGLITICLYFLTRSNAHDFYGPTGLVSAATMTQWWGSAPQFNMLWFLPNGTDTVDHLLTALLIVGIFLTVGLISRISALSVFIILLTLDSRNHFVFHPAFALLRVMALYLSMSHCGDEFSIDNIIRRKRKGNNQVIESSPWAQRLMQLQIIAVYWGALSYQLNGSAWLDGSAVYYATHLTEFQRFPIPICDNLTACQVIGIGTMLIELSLCTLIWVKEVRYWVLLAGLALHMGIEYSMVFIPLLQPLMISSYLLFIDPNDLNKIIQWGKSKCTR